MTSDNPLPRPDWRRGRPGGKGTDLGLTHKLRGRFFCLLKADLQNEGICQVGVGCRMRGPVDRVANLPRWTARAFPWGYRILVDSRSSHAGAVSSDPCFQVTSPAFHAVCLEG